MPPVWPAKSGRRQMLIHLGFTVDDLDAAAAREVSCGAKPADTQVLDNAESALIRRVSFLHLQALKQHYASQRYQSSAAPSLATTPLRIPASSYWPTIEPSRIPLARSR